MIKYCKYSSSVLFACLLSGCVLDQTQPPAPVEQSHGQQTTTPSTGTEQPAANQNVPLPPLQPVPETPKLTSINWSATVQPLVDKMVKTQGITSGSVLMVDRIKNSTNGSIQSDNANSALTQALTTSPFTLVTAEQLAQAKQVLGLSPNDSLNSRGKAIGLARNLNAEYVLYTTARGDVKAARLQMQLMLVKTGEIIWTGSGEASY